MVYEAFAQDWDWQKHWEYWSLKVQQPSKMYSNLWVLVGILQHRSLCFILVQSPLQKGKDEPKIDDYSSIFDESSSQGYAYIVDMWLYFCLH